MDRMSVYDFPAKEEPAGAGQVQQDQMIVRSAGHHIVTKRHKHIRKMFAVFHHTMTIFCEGRVQYFRCRHGLMRGG